MKARLFRRDGTPVGEEFPVYPGDPFYQVGPAVAFASNGTVLVAWLAPDLRHPEGQADVYARRFAASPGEEPCAVAGGKLLCDTGRSGGFPELQLTFGGRPGEVTLLGDFDGDGREDVCAWFKGRFRCDLDHEEAPAEAKVDFGLPTDIPLLGDVDGDQRDDLCLFSQGKWDCLMRAGARLTAAFGNPDDAPALGDLDRDGRADLCVLRGGNLLLCDTARDGGAAEETLPLELPPGARPLFGNLDGL